MDEDTFTFSIANCWSTSPLKTWRDLYLWKYCLSKNKSELIERILARSCTSNLLAYEQIETIGKLNEKIQVQVVLSVFTAISAVSGCQNLSIAIQRKNDYLNNAIAKDMADNLEKNIISTLIDYRRMIVPDTTPPSIIEYISQMNL